MRKLALFFCTALLASSADDPWTKVKELKTGTELRVIKRGVAQPLLVKMDELTDENLLVIEKNKQTAIPRDQIDRVDARPSGKSRLTTETKVTDNAGDPKAVIPGPEQQNGTPGPRSTTSSNVSIGSKPDFETIYRRPTGAPMKK